MSHLPALFGYSTRTLVVVEPKGHKVVCVCAAGVGFVIFYFGTKKEELYQASIMGVPGCVFSQLLQLIDQNDRSFQKYLLAYLLLTKNDNLLSDLSDDVFVKELDVPKVCLMGLKKRRTVVKIQNGSDKSDEVSNDCFIPGLHDDVALNCLGKACRSDYAFLACLNKRFNSLVRSEYLYRVRRQLKVSEHWVYLACSMMPWEAFDPFRQRWMKLPRIPCDQCFSCADKESLAVGTRLLVFGREVTGLAIWMYSLVTNNWSRCESMNLPRCLFGSSSSGEIAIVAGGSDKVGHVLKCAELYNSELGTWETLPNMNVPRKLCSGFFMDEKFYVIGGMSSHIDSLTSGEEYNLKTRTWRIIENMYPGGNNATQSPPLIAVVNNQLYAADQSTNIVKKYDKSNNVWSVVRPLPVRADSSNGWGLAFKACGDKLLVIGGHRRPQGEAILLHYWCPEDGNNGDAEWDVLAIRERAGAFVHNCAIMGC